MAESEWKGYQLGPEFMKLLNLIGPEMYPSPDQMPDMVSQGMGAVPFPQMPLMYSGPENMAMTHPDVMRGRDFMAPWGGSDNLYGKPRPYDDDMLVPFEAGLAPKDI